LRSPYEFALRTASKIRKIGYQYALILRHDHWWGAWLAQLSGFRYRLGFDSADTALFLTHHAPFKHAHAIEQNLRLVEKFLEKDLSDQIDYRYETHLNDRAFIRGYLAEWGVEPQDETLCLHTGADIRQTVGAVQMGNRGGTSCLNSRGQPPFFHWVR
jgi:ADP-heptose:LPS heptosyltransferase